MITIWFLIVLALIVAAYDVWRELKKDDSTISAVLLRASMHYPILSFLFGILAGHLFWAQTV